MRNPFKHSSRRSSAGMCIGKQIPVDPGDHAVDFAHRWADRLDEYRALRMQELGVPDHLLSAPDFGGDGKWRAFIARERVGGNITTGITVNSGVYNTGLISGKGSRRWAAARLRNRVDAVIAHEYEEEGFKSREASVKRAVKPDLPISDGARRILRAIAR